MKLKLKLNSSMVLEKKWILDGHSWIIKTDVDTTLTEKQKLSRNVFGAELFLNNIIFRDVTKIAAKNISQEGSGVINEHAHLVEILTQFSQQEKQVMYH